MKTLWTTSEPFATLQRVEKASLTDILLRVMALEQMGKI
jgi:hypothetical protein